MATKEALALLARWEDIDSREQRVRARLAELVLRGTNAFEPAPIFGLPANMVRLDRMVEELTLLEGEEARVRDRLREQLGAIYRLGRSSGAAAVRAAIEKALSGPQ